MRSSRFICKQPRALAQRLGVVLSLACVAPNVRAQAADPLEAFLGVWSGVFTTQDDPFWSVEDFPCFPGCSPEMRDYMVKLLDDPANNEVPTGALMGRSIQFAEEQLKTMLTPTGLRIQQENTPESDPKLHCQPYGFVRQVTNALPIKISRDGEHLLIRYEEWSLLRTIYMDGRAHPQYRTPTLLGHSVGHLEGGELVVDTARVNPDWISDYTRGGHSGELTAVERYSIRDNPRRLEVKVTLTDPVTLTQPYVLIKTWLATPDVTLVEDRCAEQPGKYD